MVRGAPLGAAGGFLADRVFGEPPLRPHPVSAFGSVMARLEHNVWRDDRLVGAFHAAAGSSLGLLAGCALRGLVGAGLPSTVAATYLAVAGRGLLDAARRVAAALNADDLEEARLLLPALVGRDPNDLDEKEITRAVVESVAENTVDAVVAPLLWAAAGGAPGALCYRAVNTMDSMIGRRSVRYRRYGWAGARLDDASAWIPARVTAAAVAAIRPRSAHGVWKAVSRDAPLHPSPNAGVAEAAFAAALGLRLGGENRYGEHVEIRRPLGSGRPPELRDIDEAVRLSSQVGATVALLLAALGLAGGRRRR